MITSLIDKRQVALYTCIILLKLKRTLSLVSRPEEQQIGDVCEQDGEGKIFTGQEEVKKESRKFS